MAGSDSGSSGADPPSSRSQDRPTIFDDNTRLSRRLFTLVTITILLNTLLWSSVLCLGSSIYQVASDSHDVTNIAPVVLTSISALATILYTIVHTIFSFKQRKWSHDERHASAIKNTDYAAVRMVVALCAFWLVTSGWNMIIVARRPVCLEPASGLQAWEYGPRCYVGRIGIAFATVALVASCALFGVLATVRRPFEAHLFQHGFQRPQNLMPALCETRKPSYTRRPSYASEKYPLGHQRSTSSFRTAETNVSGAEADTLDWNFRLPALSSRAPSPAESLGLGIFTSNSVPPPIPSAYATPPRLQSPGAFAPTLHPTVSQNLLTRPPRLSGQDRTFSSAPSAVVAAQYSASTLRALHPPQPSKPRTSRSHSQLPSLSYSYRDQYSRSAASLTRPHRLSTMTSVGSADWSLRNGSSGHARLYSVSSAEDSVERKRSAREVVAMSKCGSSHSESSSTTNEKVFHRRPSSAPASDAVRGIDGLQRSSRMAMGWKPHLAGPRTHRSQNALRLSSQQASLERRHAQKLVHSSSTGFLGNFSPDIRPYNDGTTLEDMHRQGLLSRGMVGRKPPPIQRSFSANEVMSTPDTMNGAVDPAQATAVMMRKMPQDIRLHGRKSTGAGVERPKKARFDDPRNPPSPRVARR